MTRSGDIHRKPVFAFPIKRKTYGPYISIARRCCYCRLVVVVVAAVAVVVVVVVVVVDALLLLLLLLLFPHVRLITTMSSVCSLAVLARSCLAKIACNKLYLLTTPKNVHLLWYCPENFVASLLRGVGVGLESWRAASLTHSCSRNRT